MEEALYEGVSLIEWPEKMGGYLPKNSFMVKITGEQDKRKIEISSTSEEKISRLQKVFASC